MVTGTTEPTIRISVLESVAFGQVPLREQNINTFAPGTYQLCSCQQTADEENTVKDKPGLVLKLL
jgi:hypothetical protein